MLFSCLELSNYKFERKIDNNMDIVADLDKLKLHFMDKGEDFFKGDNF